MNKDEHNMEEIRIDIIQKISARLIDELLRLFNVSVKSYPCDIKFFTIDRITSVLMNDNMRLAKKIVIEGLKNTEKFKNLNFPEIRGNIGNSFDDSIIVAQNSKNSKILFKISTRFNNDFISYLKNTKEIFDDLFMVKTFPDKHVYSTMKLIEFPTLAAKSETYFKFSTAVFPYIYLMRNLSRKIQELKEDRDDKKNGKEKEFNYGIDISKCILNFDEYTSIINKK